MSHCNVTSLNLPHLLLTVSYSFGGLAFKDQWSSMVYTKICPIIYRTHRPTTRHLNDTSTGSGVHPLEAKVVGPGSYPKASHVWRNSGKFLV